MYLQDLGSSTSAGVGFESQAAPWLGDRVVVDAGHVATPQLLPACISPPGRRIFGCQGGEIPYPGPRADLTDVFLWASLLGQQHPRLPDTG